MLERFEIPLKQVGFTKIESKVLLHLFEHGPFNATNLAASLHMQRPNIYDVLKSLENKGFISRYVEGKDVLYKGINEVQFTEQIKFIEESYKSYIQTLLQLGPILSTIKYDPELVDIRICRGFKGARNVLFESVQLSVKSKKELLGIGVRNEQFLNEDAIYYKRYMKQRASEKIKGRYILEPDSKMVMHKNTKIKYLKGVGINPAATYVYENVISIWLWFKDPIVITIANKDVAEAYRRYFNYLWKQAKAI